MTLPISSFLLAPHEVHLWCVSLPELIEQKENLFLLLNAQETQRAGRFHAEIHQQRYGLARAMLRRILHLYTNMPPQEIDFSYGPRGKPYLKDPRFNLQFNVSHSHDMAVYAFTKGAEIGVDIEKINVDQDHDRVAKRFFSAQEYSQLMQLSETERIAKFYRLWARKEALIKGLGEGLFVPLADFSVSLHDLTESVVFVHNQQPSHWHLETFITHPDYEAAFATAQSVSKVKQWRWPVNGIS